MSVNKYFVLGLGSQKAGTTWLHHYLSELEFSDFGFAKEYQIFTATSVPNCSGYLKTTPRTVRALLKKDFDIWKGNLELKRLSFMSDPQNYFDYFGGILSRPECNLTGDMSPAHIGLPPETLAFIQDQFKQRGIKVRPVFLMRDPINRLQSMVRMHFRNKGVETTLKKEFKLMKKWHLNNQDRMRSDYQDAISRFEEVFGDDIFIEFYETLFRQDTIEALCSFIGVPFIEADFTVRKNESRTNNQLTDEMIEYFYEGYRSTYQFCSERFGQEKVNRHWTSVSAQVTNSE